MSPVPSVATMRWPVGRGGNARVAACASHCFSAGSRVEAGAEEEARAEEEMEAEEGEVEAEAEEEAAPRSQRRSASVWMLHSRAMLSALVLVRSMRRRTRSWRVGLSGGGIDRVLQEAGGGRRGGAGGEAQDEAKRPDLSDVDV